MTWRTWTLLLLGAALSLACEDDKSAGGSSSTDVAVDAASDADAIDDTLPEDTSELAQPEADEEPLPEAVDESTDGSADDAADAGPEGVGCQDALSGELRIAFFPEQPSTQIHPELAFDGQAFWVVANVPDVESGDFEVYATRVACDGSVLVAPFRVHEAGLGNTLEPHLAVSGQRLIIVWQTDTGGDPNLFIHYRVFQLDGEAVMDGEEVLPLADASGEMNVSAWMPRAAAQPGGGFAVVGAFADPLVERWQSFVVRLDADGGPLTGDDGAPQGLIRLFPEEGVGQAYPALLSMDNGSLFAAWERTVDDQAERVAWVVLYAGDDVAEGVSGATPSWTEGQSGGPSLASLGGSADPVWLARRVQGSRVNVAFRDLRSPMDPENPHGLNVGLAAADDYSPLVVPTEAGGILVWMRTRAYIYTDIMAQAFVAEPEPAMVGDELLLNPADETGFHAAYGISPPSAVRTPEGHVFVVWAEADQHPEYRVVGRFLDL